MKLVTPDLWRPQGIDDLEPAAWEALRADGCVCVVAGPGAGKTEFLAQRAAYLLQTGMCRAPFRVLAISFKKDAAENLRIRVNKRCSPELASRFDSMTFDQFTKGLLDRFSTAVPAPWRPSKPYEVVMPTGREVQNVMDAIRVRAGRQWQTEVAGITVSTFEQRHVGITRLPTEVIIPTTGTEFAIAQWWSEFLPSVPTSRLTFVMINRLAELLVRTNPQIGKALRLTYPFVFMDEFQDTTHAQYDFLQSVFGGGRAKVTGVGDNKQRIMGWAGALPDAFQQFRTDFNAQEIALQFNFRSSPGLVSIQHVVARAIDAGAATTQARTAQSVDGDVAAVWTFSSEEVEADRIAEWLVSDMRARNTAPREYALLVKQRSDDFEVQLSRALGQAGVGVRNESRKVGRTTLQDLLAEEAVRIAVSVLRIASQTRAPEAWAIASDAIAGLRNADIEDEVQCRKVEDELRMFTTELRELMATMPPTPESALDFANRVVAFLDTSHLRRTFVEYGTGENLAIALEGFRLHLSQSAEGIESWQACLDIFEGKDFVPLMTVHKSKGLEYDTVIFVGLDDQTWWSHSPGNLEGLATFFVALSRAKQRAIFTFCTERGPRTRVDEMYQLLREAGVVETNYT